MKSRIKYIGPISYFRVKEKDRNFISAWLTAHDADAYGWEWGTDGTDKNPSLVIRIGHFDILSYERFNNGFTLFVLGFWYMS